MHTAHRNILIPWRVALRNLVRATRVTIQGADNFPIDLCGQTYRVVYEARNIHTDRDYQFLQLLAKGRSVIFDVGAQFGLVSMLMASSMESGGKIYAFEALEETSRIASQNIRLNMLADQIELVNAVIGGKTGDTCKLFGGSTIEGFLGVTQSYVNKSLLSLDDFAETNRLVPELVKIDVEGAEIGVLHGMRSLLKEGRIVVFLELHTLPNVPLAQNAANILRYLAEVNYKMFYLRTKAIVTDPCILSQRGRCHVLLIPGEFNLTRPLLDFDTSSL